MLWKGGGGRDVVGRRQGCCREEAGLLLGGDMETDCQIHRYRGLEKCHWGGCDGKADRERRLMKQAVRCGMQAGRQRVRQARREGGRAALKAGTQTGTQGKQRSTKKDVSWAYQSPVDT